MNESTVFHSSQLKRNKLVHGCYSKNRHFRFRSYSGLFFPVFALNTERYSLSLRIQSKCGKIRTRITPNTDTFYAVRFVQIKHKDRNEPEDLYRCFHDFSFGNNDDEFHGISQVGRTFTQFYILTLLTHSFPMHPFSTPENIRKP